MASRTRTTLVDDIDGNAAVETVELSLDGVDYAIDLNARNAARLRASLATWVSAARRKDGVEPAPRRVLEPVGDSRNALIRSWAAKEGLSVPARGRIPQEVRRQYDACH